MEQIKYWVLKNLEKHLGGHVSIGNVTIFGFNAMHVCIQAWTKKYGYICFHPTIWMGTWWEWYLYFSPDGTPQSSTFAIGPGVKEYRQRDRNGLLAKQRRELYGHNFDSRITHPDIYPEIVSLYPEFFSANN